MPEEHERLTYTVKDVSEVLGISLRTTYVVMRDGTLPGIRLGTRWLVPRQALEERLSSSSPLPGVSNSEARANSKD